MSGPRAVLGAAVSLAVLLAACSGSAPTTGPSNQLPSTTTNGPASTGTLSGSPTSATPSTSTTEASPSASPKVPAGATPMPASESKLEPGTYAYPGFVPPISLRVGQGWTAGHQVGDFFDVDRPDAVVVFAEAGFVYDWQGVRRPADDLSPRAAAALLAANHDLGAGPVQHARIGGVQGFSVELTPREPDNMLGRTVVYFVATDRSYWVTFVRVDGTLLAVTAVAIHRPPTKAFAEAEPVIRSVRFA